MNYLHKAMQIKQQVQLVGLPLNLELIVITKGESFNILMLMVWSFIGDTMSLIGHWEKITSEKN